MKYLRSAAAMLIMLAPFVLTQAGETATYEWTDDAGVVHFTDDKGNIPQKFLKKVKELNTGSDENVQAPAAPAPQSTPPEASSPARGATLYGGYGERYWRTRFATLRGEIKSLEDSLPAMQNDLDKLRRKRVVYGRASDRVAVEKAAQAIAKNEERLKELQEQLKNLDNEASQADVPSEWRQ
jgi:uncharacterized protein DUF4124